MKKFPLCNKALIALLTFLAFSQPALAEVKTGFDHYVTDSLDVPMRSQPGYKFRIVRMLKTGSKLEVLEVNADKWARVSYIDGKKRTWEGWMPSSLLQNIPVATLRLAAQEEKYATLENEFNQHKQEKETLQSRFDEVSKELEEVQKSHFQLKKQHENLVQVSENAVAMNSENEQLNETVKTLNAENLILKEQLNEAGDTVQRQWFLTGGGVLLLGLLLGRFARMPEKRNRWDRL